ncbi:hypothetical protein SAMN06265365_12416 [Tistlia consotensis]|uniref:Uncharacterized protein n=1 Tax=Tistlia consotensis USBA 355 TaxID=560819 RepID=A0A1Y6CJ97_9PROT|nr:hypothetical protein [Tistlia consotensis]SMF68128.1 hypothetical protein SAMN05428998_12789 [Tistlia consotensis USBA 355]SNR99030.1 hypothetical protein SAMN06265365_12416 [Tistlia consotensis]
MSAPGSIGGGTANARIDRIEARLAAARAALENDGTGDLEGLELEVSALSTDVAALPAQETTGLRPRLLALLDEINRLSADYRDGLERLARELGETGRRRQAVSAYHKGQRHKGHGNKPGGGGR